MSATPTSFSAEFDGHDALLVTWRLVDAARARTADGSRPPGDGLFDHEKIDPAKITGIVMASVVPLLTPIMHGMAHRYFDRDALVSRIRRRTRACRSSTSIPPRSARTASPTASRATNDTAGQDGQPLIIADLGTATTFDAVTAKGEYLGGGFIAGARRSPPGSSLSTERPSSREWMCEAAERDRAQRRSARSSSGCSTVSRYMVERLVARA